MKVNWCHFLLVMVVIAMCVQDSDAWGRRRRRWIRWRRVWEVTKVVAKVVVAVAGVLSDEDCKDIYVSRDNWVNDPDDVAVQGSKQPTAAPRDPVYINRESENEPCYDEKTCKKLIRNMRAADIANGYTDIRYNFVLGQDGQVYEGRGWDYIGEFEDQDKTVGAIGIAVAGSYPDFSPDAPSTASLDALHSLVACGIRNTKLKPETSFVMAQNSPLYDVILTWGKKSATV